MRYANQTEIHYKGRMSDDMGGINNERERARMRNASDVQALVNAGTENADG